MSTLQAFSRTIGKLDVPVPVTGEQIRSIVSFLLCLSALVLFTAAAWMFATPAGLAMAGVSCIVLDEKIPGRRG